MPPVEVLVRTWMLDDLRVIISSLEKHTVRATKVLGSSTGGLFGVFLAMLNHLKWCFCSVGQGSGERTSTQNATLTLLISFLRLGTWSTWYGSLDKRKQTQTLTVVF
jgi:hypothetical protein